VDARRATKLLQDPASNDWFGPKAGPQAPETLDPDPQKRLRILAAMLALGQRE